ncbi:MAG: shikimate dehydrogenase [Bacteroidales bacterium]|nr:shikimate dehydrogenase [Bacteroidales bacterium]
MKKYGLIGYPLGHSFSKGYFAEKFKKCGIVDCKYDNYPIDSIEKLKKLLYDEPELEGLNVTIPYKEKVLPFLDDIDINAKEIGAVNTLKIKRIGDKITLKGYNTDVYGFSESLKKIIGPQHTNALILGTGGAAKAVAWALKSMGISYKYVSRQTNNKQYLNYTGLNAEIIAEHKLIINTSPAGMYPNVNIAPDIPYEGIAREHVLYDLIYNPEETLFLKYGAQKKATTLNGLPMLYLQAERAWEIWNSNT